MHPRPAAMLEDCLVRTPGILQRISQDGHRGEVTRVVHLLRESEDSGGTTGGVEDDGVEGIAKDVADEKGLLQSGISPFGATGLTKSPLPLRGLPASKRYNLACCGPAHVTARAGEPPTTMDTRLASLPAC